MDVGTLVPGEPDVADFPRFLRFERRFHCSARCKNAVRIVHANNFVKLQEIDAIGLQSAERLFNLPRSRFLVAPVDFGHQERSLTIAVAQRLAHADFTLTFVVVPAVIEKIDSVVDGGAGDADTLRLLEPRLAKVESAYAYRGNFFPCAAERPMRNFSLGFSGLRVPREAHQHGGTGGDSQKLPASNRCVVTGLAFLFILAPNSRSITGTFTAHRPGIRHNVFLFGLAD